MLTGKKQEIIEKAIANRYQVTFTYRQCFRVVNPHFDGLMNGQLQLHAYQVGGDSESGSVPEWRNFRVNDIENIAISNQVFMTPDRGYNPDGAHYERIYKQVDFSYSPPFN